MQMIYSLSTLSMQKAQPIINPRHTHIIYRHQDTMNEGEKKTIQIKMTTLVRKTQVL